MSQVLSIEPGESVTDYIHRIASTAPPMTPALADRLRPLLPSDRESPAAPRQDIPAAA